MSNIEETSRCEGVITSHFHSSRPSSAPHLNFDERIKELLDPAWLRAHNRTTNSAKIASIPQELISISDTSPRPLDEVEDLGCIYRADEVGDNIDKLNDLFTFMDQSETSPSRLGRGCGKDIRLFLWTKDHLNNPDAEDEDNISTGIQYFNGRSLDFGSDFNEGEKAEVRKYQEMISCAGIASTISFE